MTDCVDQEHVAFPTMLKDARIGRSHRVGSRPIEMKPAKQVIMALVSLIVVLTAVRLIIPAPPPRSDSTVPSLLVRPNTPFERSLRQGWKRRSRALVAEIGEREALESWDPKVDAGLEKTTVRNESLVSDRSGELRQAHEVARQAARLARTPSEARRAAALLRLIERDLGYGPGRAMR
jgi:hypothetical protein